MTAFTRTRRRTAVALGTAAVLAVGLTTALTPGASAHPHAGSTGRADTAAAAKADVLPYQDPSLPVRKRVADLLGRMSLDEKIGQMTQAERAEVDTDTSKITTDLLGSVLSGGGSVPTPNTPTAWADMVDRYQAAALATPLGIPLLYGVDTVHGDGNMLGATVFPHNIGLGASRDPALVRRVEHVAASETRSTGPQWAFAPCLCVARDDRWGRIYESFGESPALVESMETAIAGLQGPRGHLSDSDRVLATAKHFAGDGLTTYGTGSNNQATGTYPIDQGVDQVDHATFKRLALDVYVPAIKRYHVGSVMPSYSDVDWTEDGLGNPVNMHANADLIQGWLKDQQDFHGIVISDYNGIDHIAPKTSTFADKVEAGVNAGIDMFMQPQNFGDFETTLKTLVDGGQVSMARIDDAVSRILTAKFQLGLFEHPVHRPHPPVAGRRQGAPSRRPPRGARVAGAPAERPAHPPALAERARVRRRQQRRQHREPGRWLDAHLAGRLDERDPGHDHPPGHPPGGGLQPRHLQRGRVRPGRQEGRRRRRGR